MYKVSMCRDEVRMVFIVRTSCGEQKIFGVIWGDIRKIENLFQKSGKGDDDDRKCWMWHHTMLAGVFLQQCLNGRVTWYSVFKRGKETHVVMSVSNWVQVMVLVKSVYISKCQVLRGSNFNVVQLLQIWKVAFQKGAFALNFARDFWRFFYEI